MFVLLLSLPGTASAQGAGVPDPVRGQATFSTAGGYGRLVFRFAVPVDAQVRMAGGILVVSFRDPVDVPVDKINAGNADWIGAARRDPDGRALRFALARKVKVNTIPAAERLFVDLLPEPWTAALPGLPQDVVNELNERTRAAERAARAQAELQRQQKPPPVRIRVAQHPTFTRYIFELPDLTGVSTQRGRDRLAVTFARPIEFDLGEAKAAAPPGVEDIDTSVASDTSAVRFAFSGEVDLRTFREDFNYVVDVTPIGKQAQRSGPPGELRSPLLEPPPGLDAPQTVPVDPDAAPPVVPVPPRAAGVMPQAGNQPGQNAPDSNPPTAPAPAAAPVQSPDAKPAVPAKPSDAPASEAPAAKPVAAPALPADPKRPVTAELRRQGDSLRMRFVFGAPTPAAVFQRADTLWLVFDTPASIDVAALEKDSSRTIRSANVTRSGEAQVVRLKLERPRLASMTADGRSWSVTIGDSLTEPSKPLGIARNIVGPGRSSITIPFDDPRALHRLKDPDAGDTILVVTGLAPARGFLKPQNFVELRTLPSTHGIAVQALADDVGAELSADKVLLARPGGLAISEAAPAGRQAALPRAVTFDSQLWGFDRQADFNRRQFELVSAAAAAPPARRAPARLQLARFYMSREMFPEAKAVLDVAIADDRPTAENPGALVLRAIASIMVGRADVALKDLSSPAVGNQHDAQLWRALAYARQGKWAQAREAFRHVEGAMTTLPLELQRIVLKEAMRASIEAGDFATASIRLNDFETVGVPREMEPAVAVLTGRLAEGLGRTQDALASYKYASDSWDRPASAAGRLREVSLRFGLGDLRKPEVVDALETLSTVWRGDEIEVEALGTLSKLYTADARYREAFQAVRTAVSIDAHSDITRQMQDAAAQTFDALFLAGKGDGMAAIDSLALFYDFREFTPIGRRGDEMIRRLSDRLVAVDLLDQAAELLQHQVDNRLQGAARAQVATRLAVVYLMAHKPARAQAALRATRTADLSNEVRHQRLLIEARALSDIGRHELAIEVVSNIPGREATRLRSDVYWAAQRWRASAEQMELLYGDRWKDFQPLTDAERSDILRAAVGFALADDQIGIARLKEKYAAKMSEGPDQRSFALVTGGLGIKSAEFRDVARTIASVDTLKGFLRDMRARYPEINAFNEAQPAPAVPPAAAAAAPAAPVPAPPAARPAAESTGSVTQNR